MIYSFTQRLKYTHYTHMPSAITQQNLNQHIPELSYFTRPQGFSHPNGQHNCTQHRPEPSRAEPCLANFHSYSLILNFVFEFYFLHCKHLEAVSITACLHIFHTHFNYFKNGFNMNFYWPLMKNGVDWLYIDLLIDELNCFGPVAKVTTNTLPTKNACSLLTE